MQGRLHPITQRRLPVTVLCGILATVPIALSGSPLVDASTGPTSAAITVPLGLDTDLGPPFTRHAVTTTGHAPGSSTWNARAWADPATGHAEASADVYVLALYPVSVGIAIATATFEQDIAFERLCAGQSPNVPAMVNVEGHVRANLGGWSSFEWDSIGIGQARIGVRDTAGTDDVLSRWYDDTPTVDEPFAEATALSTDPGDGELRTLFVDTTAEAWVDSGHSQMDVFAHSSVEDPHGAFDVTGVSIDFVDTSPPAAYHALTADRRYGAWYSSPVTVQITSSDAESCTERIVLEDASGTIADHAPGYDGDALVWHDTQAASGGRTFTYTATNYQGIAEQRQLTYAVDVDPPSSTASIACERTVTGACQGEARLSFTCSDGESGCVPAHVRYRIDGGPWQVGQKVVVDTPGQHQVDHYAVDVVGNEESPPNTVVVDIACETGLPPVPVLDICPPVG